MSVLHSTPALYVVATPMGNLGDITERARAVLSEVGIIAAEDTRHSQRLLDALSIPTRMLPLHEHNEVSAAQTLIGQLRNGMHVALITDAGTPAISDPGARAVKQVREAGFAVIPVPGACALVAAISVAGLVEGCFYFAGFLPTKSAARQTTLETLAPLESALIFYEAPHRILECIDDLLTVLGGDREITIARELTKLYEQIVTLPLRDAPRWFTEDKNHSRGEFVLIVSPPSPRDSELDAKTLRTLKLLLEELPTKSAAKIAAELTGAPKNALYTQALEWKKQTSN